MAIMTHAKFQFNWLMLTLSFGIWASEPPRVWRTTEKAGPDRVKMIRGFFYKFNRSFKNLKNVIFHVELLSPTLS